MAKRNPTQRDRLLGGIVLGIGLFLLITAGVSSGMNMSAGNGLLANDVGLGSAVFGLIGSLLLAVGLLFLLSGRNT